MIITPEKIIELRAYIKRGQDCGLYTVALVDKELEALLDIAEEKIKLEQELMDLHSKFSFIPPTIL